ncbi:flagellar basal body P-ring formation chaperone FlgA [Thalassoroseus pseudoceratinae]|uniref:flagellar basal body P-ring formation chaperone FlgA n=1 Tax=Thalassoroseus pseudoceratinae TaxID=2713176 RepID=UPI00141F3DAD|nr:flagellar basal body P-ring formation chaperone FlgA [Thalassoroseus pseudoceratinae]
MDNRESKIGMVAACLVFSVCAVSNAAVVRFHETATVDGTIVTLGDIAEVSDVDPAVSESLRETILGPAPAAGTEKPFPFADVRARLRAVGINLASVEFTGHSVVRVQSPKVMQAAVLGPISRSQPRDTQGPPSRREIHQVEQRLVRAIHETIRKRWPELQLETVKVSLLNDTITPTAGQTFRTMIASENIHLSGWQGPVDSPQTLTAITTDSLGEAVRLDLRCQITIQPFVLTVAENLPRGHLVQASDLTWSQGPDDPNAITDPANVIGRQTKRAIRRGEALEVNDLERVLLVRSRDIVTVTVRSGGITVRREMKSLDDGALGEAITVASLTGRDRLTARVTGVHTAEITSPAKSVPVNQMQAGVNR